MRRRPSDARTPPAATPQATRPHRARAPLRQHSPAGSTKARPSCRADSTIASAPRTARSSPVSASSPANSCAASASCGSCPLAARMPIAIGRSKRPDSFGRSAGARLTVTLRCGNSNCAFCKRGTHAIARFPHFGFREADDVHTGKPAGQVHFDADARRGHAGQSAAMDDCDGHPAARVTEQRAWRDGLATALIRLADARNAATQDGNHRRRPCRDRAI